MTQVFITVTGAGTWTVPSDWSNTNTIEVIGAGGGAEDGRGLGGAGGGGGYSKISNLSLTPGNIITVQVGLGGAGGASGTGANAGTDGGDTWFNGASLAASSVGAKGGKGGPTTGSGGLGGDAASGIGTTKFSGGAGGTGQGGGTAGNGGGGGAAGPGGNGGAGASTITTDGDPAGMGGGANGGGGNGVVSVPGTTGAAGGISISVGNQVGQSGGAGSSSSASPGSTGSQGSGGGGGFSDNTSLYTAGGVGGAGTEFDATHGSGGGGGGGGGTNLSGTGTGGTGGHGGLYGGGGGQGAYAVGARGAGGAGANGIIVITYFTVLSGTFYVDSSTGNDSNDGMAPTAGSGHGPWATAANVALKVFNGGASILFNRGQTFPTNISIGVSNQGSSPAWSSSNPVLFSSYGSGPNPIISVAGSSTIGFAALDVAGFIINGIDFVGPGISTGTVDGIQIQTSLTSGPRLDYIQVINCNVSQFGKNGLHVWGNGGAGGATSGFSNVTISGGSYHDNTGASAFSLCGVTVRGVYGTQNTHINVKIAGVTAYNNTGATGQSNWTGSGIMMGETGGTGLTDVNGNACGGLIDQCVAYNNGVNSSFGAGPVGIWCADCTNVVIQRCESYSNKTAGGDGGGFDLDGGITNCTIQYCYAHDNYGPGYTVYSYSDGTVLASSGCVVRYCISQHDGSAGGCGITIGNDAGTSGQTGVAVYNNTIYASAASTKAIIIGGSFAANTSGHVANNILYVTSGLQFINTAANPTGLIFSGNDYYTPGTFSITWNGTTYTSFASWVAFATAQEPIAQQLASPTVNPSLVNPGGGGTLGGYVPSSLSQYQLSFGSPMVGVGLDLNSLYSISPGTLDFYGNAVPNGRGTGFNVGAYGALPTIAVSSDIVIGYSASLVARSANERGSRTVWWS